MKKQMTQTSIKKFLILIVLVTTSISYSQVGINTTNPANGSILDIESRDKGIFIPRMDILDLTTINPVTGISGAVEEAAAAGLLVYNTFAGTGTGFYFWNGTDWTPVSAAAVTEPPIDSVSLATDEIISANTFTSVPGMTLTFTARKTSVLVNLSASGYGDPTDPNSWIEIRVLNGASSMGGTQANVHATYRPSNPASTTINTSWSAGFSKLLTGLTIGVPYTLTVQARVDGGATTNLAYIDPDTFDPDASHLTLSVMQ